MTAHFDPADRSVRPFFRVMGALLLAPLACLFVALSMPLWSAASVAAESCRPGESRLWCEIGNGLLAVTPASLQGPAQALMNLAFAALLAALAFWLIKPVLASWFQPRRLRG